MSGHKRRSSLKLGQFEPEPTRRRKSKRVSFSSHLTAVKTFQQIGASGNDSAPEETVIVSQQKDESLNLDKTIITDSKITSSTPQSSPMTRTRSTIKVDKIANSPAQKSKTELESGYMMDITTIPSAGGGSCDMSFDETVHDESQHTDRDERSVTEQVKGNRSVEVPRRVMVDDSLLAINKPETQDILHSSGVKTTGIKRNEDVTSLAPMGESVITETENVDDWYVVSNKSRKSSQSKRINQSQPPVVIRSATRSAATPRSANKSKQTPPSNKKSLRTSRQNIDSSVTRSTERNTTRQSINKSTYAPNEQSQISVNESVRESLTTCSISLNVLSLNDADTAPLQPIITNGRNPRRSSTKGQSRRTSSRNSMSDVKSTETTEKWKSIGNSAAGENIEQDSQRTSLGLGVTQGWKDVSAAPTCQPLKTKRKASLLSESLSHLSDDDSVSDGEITPTEVEAALAELESLTLEEKKLLEELEKLEEHNKQLEKANSDRERQLTTRRNELEEKMKENTEFHEIYKELQFLEKCVNWRWVNPNTTDSTLVFKWLVGGDDPFASLNMHVNVDRSDGMRIQSVAFNSDGKQMSTIHYNNYVMKDLIALCQKNIWDYLSKSSLPLLLFRISVLINKTNNLLEDLREVSTLKQNDLFLTHRDARVIVELVGDKWSFTLDLINLHVNTYPDQKLKLTPFSNADHGTPPKKLEQINNNNTINKIPTGDKYLKRLSEHLIHLADF